MFAGFSIGASPGNFLTTIHCHAMLNLYFIQRDRDGLTGCFQAVGVWIKGWSVLLGRVVYVYVYVCLCVHTCACTYMYVCVCFPEVSNNHGF